MAKLSKYEQNVAGANKGVEIDLGDGLKIMLARAGNENYQKYLKQVLKPHEKALRLKSLPDSVFEKLYIESVAETILLGWSGMEDDDGNNIPYSKEKCIEILSDVRFSDFKKLVLELADEQAVFAKESVEATKS